MAKPPISPGKPGKFKNQVVEVTDPTVDGIEIIGTFQKFDLTGNGKGKVKDLNFLGGGTDIFLDLDGSAGGTHTLTLAGTLDGIAFVNEETSFILLADNFDFI